MGGAGGDGAGKGGKIKGKREERDEIDTGYLGLEDIFPGYIEYISIHIYIYIFSQSCLSLTRCTEGSGDRRRSL